MKEDSGFKIIPLHQNFSVTEKNMIVRERERELERKYSPPWAWSENISISEIVWEVED